jgi:ketosteroid isomerase-like protein
MPAENVRTGRADVDAQQVPEAVGQRELTRSQENVETVRLAYAMMSERNFDALARVSDPDWIFDFSRAIGPQRGIYRGQDEIAQLGAATEEAFERFELSPIECLVGSAGQILVRHHVSAKGRGSGLELNGVPDATLVWELREGMVIRTTLYSNRAEALRAAGLSEAAMSEEDVDAIRRVYAEWSRGNWRPKPEIYDPEMVWGWSDEFPGLDGVYRDSAERNARLHEWLTYVTHASNASP